MALIKPRTTLESFVNLTRSQVEAAAIARRDGFALYPIRPESRAQFGELMGAIVLWAERENPQTDVQSLPEPKIIAPYQHVMPSGNRLFGATIYGENVNAGFSLTTTASLAGGAMRGVGLELDLSFPDMQHVEHIDCQPTDSPLAHLNTDSEIDMAALPEDEYRAFSLGLSLARLCNLELTHLIDEPA